MAEIKPILVNDKKYKVQMLSVLDTLDLHMETVSSMGGFIGELAKMWMANRSGKEITSGSFSDLFKGLNIADIKPIKKKIFAQVITPENQFLSDEVQIEKWFARPENRGDVWEVLVKATIELLGEYLPSFLKDIMSQGMEKAKEAQLKSQVNTEPNLSSMGQSATT